MTPSRGSLCRRCSRLRTNRLMFRAARYWLAPAVWGVITTSSGLPLLQSALVNGRKVSEEIFATIRHHTLPGDISCIFTGQRDRKKGNLFWLAPAVERVPGARWKGQAPFCLLSLDTPGANAIGRDVVLAILPRYPPGHPHHP